jgi:adenylylsulfate kinase
VTGTVVWITGLPSSGKSTLARSVKALLPDAILLDGDDLREILRPAPGYDAQARDDFYATLGGLASMLARQGHVVLVAATANRRRHRDAARALAPDFIEVWVDVTPEICAARDPKGLWASAREGRIPGFPGVGEPYEPPVAPEVVARGPDAAETIARLTRARNHRS